MRARAKSRSGTRTGRPCRECEFALAPGANFCPRCGLTTASSDPPARPGAYAVLGLLGLFTLAVLAWSLGGGARAGPVSTATFDAPEGTTTLESVSPRDVADNLFNHVVDAATLGDSAELEAFLPLALMSYDEARPLDADGLFHLATLQRIALLHAESLASARGILELHPDHLLGLGAAAAAAEALGQSGVASEYRRRFAAVYGSEIDRSLVEYVGHADFLSRVEIEAASGEAAR